MAGLSSTGDDRSNTGGSAPNPAGLAERLTPQIARDRRWAVQARVAGLACAVPLCVAAFGAGLTGSTPWMVGALVVIGVSLMLIVYGTICQMRTQRAVADLYGIDRREPPALPVLKLKTVEQFDAWLSTHDRAPADREPRRLELGTEGTRLVIPRAGATHQMVAAGAVTSNPLGTDAAGRHTRRLWLLPHEKLLLTALNPLKERRYANNPSRLRMLGEHGTAGMLLFTAAGLDVLTGFVVIVLGFVVLMLSFNAGYLVGLVGMTLALLGTLRALQTSRMRPHDVPAWTPQR